MASLKFDRSRAVPMRGDGQGQPASKTGRLVIVSNRVADLSKGNLAGGLAVAVGEALKSSGGLWFGWSGARSAEAHSKGPNIQTFGNVSTATVDLTEKEFEDYYLGFSNRCLWPLFHYRLDLAELHTTGQATYFEVNKRFAAEVAPLIQTDDTIWVHDYHLIPFAAHLRQKQVTNRIGFFLHIPFPAPELFSALPHHRDFAKTFFAYDLVGFQTVRDRENFARYAEEYLNCRRLNDGRLRGFGRTLRIEAFPIGIDAESFAAEAEKNARAPELRALAREVESERLIVGVDRLDYSKGLPERVRAMGSLLEKWPNYIGKVQLLQIAPPTREGVQAYDEIRSELERITGEVNGRYGDFVWSPVRYVNRPVPRAMLAGLFRRSRVGLVTPLRDGMNLVAKEYVAAQDPADPGVLVLSQFAGAAEQMEEALMVNPHDPAETATAIRRALEMPLGERRARHKALWNQIVSESVGWWRERFLAVLHETNGQPATPGGPSTRNALRSEAVPHEQSSDPTAR
ncbi:trehalose 6-phosphate synthase [Faunimonas pinastri]|uniref:Trehalose 6-phosphate synthase n=1 Tax=Faunimonas pinastri TaxID=1855383 RepID=A0A1H9LWE9_9HYPH|nr:trehalose-6-phosphate synthase [Faunimonas pinastri]SER15589.1 trehalose 6-phosphate synthase [Faunimonas pinastri]